MLSIGAGIVHEVISPGLVPSETQDAPRSRDGGTPTVLYGFNGKRLSAEGILREVKKRRGRAKILSSAVVTMNDGEQARIVFVRDRKKKDWLALLCT